MGRAWATDIVTTLVVALAVDAVFPWTEHIAALSLQGAWPWVIAVAAFLVVRLLVWGLFAAMSGALRLFRPESTKRSSPNGP